MFHERARSRHVATIQVMSTDADRLAARVSELEVRVAFQDDLLGTLNAGMATADATIRALRDDLANLRQSLEGLRVALGSDVRDEPPPPHY
jgi:SlyX protein